MRPRSKVGENGWEQFSDYGQRGHKKAVIAVGHHILEIAYYIMRDGRPYDELGADSFEKRHAERAARRQCAAP